MADTASPTTVVLIGDSHATMWVPALEQAATQRRWRLESLTKGDCPPMSMPVSNPLRRLMYSRCERWRKEIIARLRLKPPKLVVLSMFRGYGGGHAYMPVYTPYEPVWLEGLTRLVRELRGIGTDVLVIGPIPEPQSVVPICLSGHLDDVMACSPPTSSAVTASGIAAESSATAAGGGQYVDVTRLFCTEDRCPVIVGNALVYFDDNHLTAEYARALSPAIGALADRAFARD